MNSATPDSWFTSEQLADGITYICEPYIKAFYRCNIWHVQGRERDLLIDSGMGVVSLRQHITQLRERPVLAVASHTHFDHIGSHHEFSERLVHPAEADLLAQPSREDTLAAQYVSDDIFEQLPPAPYQSSEYSVKAAPATRLIEDGDVIDLGNRVFTVLHTPGHSPGGIALWEDKTGILFSGDIVYDGPLIEDCYHSNSKDYIASMERLLALPVTIVHGGHFPSYGRARHRQIIRAWLEDKARQC